MEVRGSALFEGRTVTSTRQGVVDDVRGESSKQITSLKVSRQEEEQAPWSGRVSEDDWERGQHPGAR